MQVLAGTWGGVRGDRLGEGRRSWLPRDLCFGGTLTTHTHDHTHTGQLLRAAASQANVTGQRAGVPTAQKARL